MIWRIHSWDCGEGLKVVRDNTYRKPWAVVREEFDPVLYWDGIGWTPEPKLAKRYKDSGHAMRDASELIEEEICRPKD